MVSAEPGRSPRTAIPQAGTQPSASVPAPVRPGTSPSKRSGGLTVRYTVGEVSAGGYKVGIAMETMIPISGWSAVLTLPAGVQVSAAWEAEFVQTGRTLILTPKPWNDDISPGQRVVIGFQASGAGQPTSCAVNGVPCAR